MSEREELLGSVLCAIAFDLGRCPQIILVQDGADFDGFVNLGLSEVARLLTQQAVVLRTIVETNAGLIDGVIASGLLGELL